MATRKGRGQPDREAEAFGLVVRFTLAPGSEDAFDLLVAQTVEQIRATEPGTLIYTCHRVDGKPAQRIFYELSRNRATFDDHESREHVRTFLREREQHVTATEVDFLHLYTGKGSPADLPDMT